MMSNERMPAAAHAGGLEGGLRGGLHLIPAQQEAIFAQRRFYDPSSHPVLPARTRETGSTQKRIAAWGGSARSEFQLPGGQAPG